MRRLVNPAVKNLSWVAKNYPPEVFFTVLAALADATGLHALRDEAEAAQQGQAFQPLLSKYDHKTPIEFMPVHDPRPAKLAQALLRQVKAALKKHPDQSFRSGHTPYDKWLPWLAKQAEVARRAHIAQRSWPIQDALASFDGRLWNTWTPHHVTMLAAVRALERDPWMSPYDARLIATWPSMRNRFRISRSSHEPPVRLLYEAYDDPVGYARRASDLTRGFGAVAEWARETGAKLEKLDYEEAKTKAFAHWGDLQGFHSIMLTKDPTGRLVYEWPDGWSVVELMTKRDLDVEGAAMKHCVWTYSEDDLVHNGGHMQIFSLRSPEGRLAATMQWNNAQGFEEVKAFANSVPRLQDLVRIMEFRERYPLEGDVEAAVVDVTRPGYKCLACKADKWLARIKLDGVDHDVFGFMGAHENGINVYPSKELEAHIELFLSANEMWRRILHDKEQDTDFDDPDQVTDYEYLEQEMRDDYFELSDFEPDAYMTLPDFMPRTPTETRELESEDIPSSLWWALLHGPSKRRSPAKGDTTFQVLIEADDAFGSDQDELIEWIIEWLKSGFTFTRAGEDGQVHRLAPGEYAAQSENASIVKLDTGDVFAAWSQKTRDLYQGLVESGRASLTEVPAGIYRAYKLPGSIVR